jgi:hypothetical protein
MLNLAITPAERAMLVCALADFAECEAARAQRLHAAGDDRAEAHDAEHDAAQTLLLHIADL